MGNTKLYCKNKILGIIEVIVKDETIWATQKAIAGLFDVGVPAISKHLKNIFESGELDEKVVVSILENTTRHGALQGKTQTKNVKYYNLDAIISVGYRVNSIKATRFRVWATNILKEYIQKGFKIDEERMKQGNTRDLRTSGKSGSWGKWLMFAVVKTISTLKKVLYRSMGQADTCSA